MFGKESDEQFVERLKKDWAHKKPVVLTHSDFWQLVNTYERHMKLQENLKSFAALISNAQERENDE